MRIKGVGISLVSLAGWSLSFILTIPTVASSADEPNLVSFSGPVPEIPRRNPNIKYDLDLSKERFLLFVPSGYTGREAYGLIVYTSPGSEKPELPAGWKWVLERRRLLFLAAQSAGNERDSASRCGLAVLGALMTSQKYKIDPNRVYAAGFSGGARMSGRLGLFQPDVFRGTIQSCGADFYNAVPQTHPVTKETAAMGQYGLLKATPEEIDLAKASARFVLITGSGDFRYADILNLYEGGFAKSPLKTQLIDVPGLGHEDCGPKALSQALDFIEGVQSVPASAPAAPAWMALPPAKWPRIALVPDMVLKDKSHSAGPGGFLTRLPGGVVIAASAKHAVCSGGPVTAIEATYATFQMRPARLPKTSQGAALLKLAIKPSDAERLDCVLMTVAAQTFPFEVRPARDTPADEGETVYLLGVSFDGNSRQEVRKGKVRRSYGDDEFTYELEDGAETIGFRGQPVLDARGNIVGLHLGTVKYGEKAFRRALNMTTVIAVCTAPGASRAAPKPATSRPASVPASNRP